MSRHYLIDGYNVIKQVTFLSGAKLKNGRDGLVRLIEQRRLHGSRRNEVTIVFDGNADISAPQIRTSFIRVLFSSHESADSRIKRMVERSPNPRCIIVVSDDKEIVFYCRSLGAEIMQVREFLKGRKLRQVRPAPDAEDEKFDTDSRAAREITAELEKIWLDPEDNR